MVGPGPKGHVAGLGVKGVVGDVHGARGSVDTVGDPEHLPGVLYDGQHVPLHLMGVSPAKENGKSQAHIPPESAFVGYPMRGKSRSTK